MKPGHTGLRERMHRLLVGDLLAFLLGVLGLLDPPDGLGRDVDAWHLRRDEPHPANRSQDADRRNQGAFLAQAGVVRRVQETLEQLWAVADLKLQEARTRECLRRCAPQNGRFSSCIA